MELPLKLRIREESVKNTAPRHTVPWFLKRPPEGNTAHRLTGPAGLLTASHTGGRDARFPPCQLDVLGGVYLRATSSTRTSFSASSL